MERDDAGDADRTECDLSWAGKSYRKAYWHTDGERFVRTLLHGEQRRKGIVMDVDGDGWRSLTDTRVEQSVVVSRRGLERWWMGAWNCTSFSTEMGSHVPLPFYSLPT